MGNKEEILNKLKLASQAYYNNEESILSDEEYDKLVLYAKDKGWLEQDKELNDGAEININTEDIIKHKVPMLSLAKANSLSDIENYFNYMLKNTTGKNIYFIEPKLDGLAASIVYNKDTKEIELIKSRGTGEYGENLSYLISTNDLEIENLLLKLPENSNMTELRGELYCPKSALQYNNQNRGIPFKNERIAAAGIVKKAKLGLGYKAKLRFTPYFAFNENQEVELPQEFNSSITLFPKQKGAKTLEELNNMISLGKIWKDEIDAPTDGIVIKSNVIYNDFSSTNHHPKQFIAYKYPGESKMSKIIKVNWQMGKTGKYTPVANIEPVVIDGVEINNVTLNNIEWLNEREIKIGSIVEVIRANDVIPKILKVISNGDDTEEITPPEKCYYCNQNLVNIICENDDCEFKQQQQIINAVGKGLLDIEGLNSSLITALKINSLKDLFDVELESLSNSKYESGVSLGEKRAKEIYDKIQNSKNNTYDYVWLSIFNIPSVGKTTAKLLLKELGSIDNILNSDITTLSNIKGVGFITAQKIVESQDKCKLLWDYLLKEVNITPLVEVKNSNSTTFAVTGSVPETFKNRNEFVKYMEDKGYTYHSSIKKDTNILITDNPNSNSSKIVKARKLGLEIKSFENF